MVTRNRNPNVQRIQELRRSNIARKHRNLKKYSRKVKHVRGRLHDQ